MSNAEKEIKIHGEKKPDENSTEEDELEDVVAKLLRIGMTLSLIRQALDDTSKDDEKE